jgi:hypothetical protein
MSLAPSALVQLESACDLFSKSAKVFRAEPVLVSKHFTPLDSVPSVLGGGIN